MKIEKLSKIEAEIYIAGYDKGYNKGKQAGDAEMYHEGYHAACDDIREH